MTPILKNLLAIALFVYSVAGCKARSPVPASAAQATFEDTAPAGEQNWTMARSVSLGRYAKDLLAFDGNEAVQHNEQGRIINEWFADAGVDDPEPLSTYTIELGPYDECFWEEGLSDYDLWWDSHKQQMKLQIEAAARFVRDYHYAMLGRNHGAFSFKRLIICPEKQVGTKMVLQGYNLYVGVPYSSVGNYLPMSHQELFRLWNAGYPIGYSGEADGFLGKIKTLFSTEAKARMAAVILWKVFNPLSPIRSSIRKALHASGLDLSSRLDNLAQRYRGGAQLTAGSEPGALKKELASDFFDNGGVIDREKLTDELDTVLSLTDAQALLFVGNWKCGLRNGKLRAEIEDDGMVATQEALANEENVIERDVRAGLVAVVNHHRIDVRVATGTGTHRRYFSPTATRRTQIRTNVRAGLVAVDTSDDITVAVDTHIDFGKSLRTASLVSALRATTAGQSLCAN